MMYPVIDAPVIDRLFQPLADRLQTIGLSCFQVARFFTDGATLTLTASLLCWVSEKREMGVDWVDVSVAGALILLSVLAMMAITRLFILRMERSTKAGLLNFGRSAMLPCRLIGFMLMVEHALDIYHQPSWSHIFDCVGYGWYMIACYFASCTPRPPKYQFKPARGRFAFGW